jgi:nitrate reductase gamma subunit
VVVALVQLLAAATDGPYLLIVVPTSVCLAVLALVGLWLRRRWRRRARRGGYVDE